MSHTLVTPLLYVTAALFEIAGCYSVWVWWRLDGAVWWWVPGLACLALFAFLLSLVDANYAGRAFAAYGGVYIITSLTWLWLVERHMPDRWDVLGGALCLAGAAFILLGPRSA